MLFLFAILVSVLTAQVPQISTGTSAWELGTRIVADVPGQITAIRFFRLAEDPGPHVGRVWASSGEKLAEAQFVNESASGWQEQALPMPLSVQAGSVLTISVGTPGGVHFPILPQAFAKPLTDGHLTYRSGAFVDTPGKFPASDAVHGYARDVVFVADKQPMIAFGPTSDNFDALGAVTLSGFEPGSTVTVEIKVTNAKGVTITGSGPLTIPVEPK